MSQKAVKAKSGPKTKTSSSKSKKEEKAEKRKHHVLSSAESRQLELLKKYYVVDEKARIVNVRFSYDKAGDLFEEDVGDINHPRLKNDLFDAISAVAENIPLNYRIRASLRINDYEDYTAEEIAGNISDTMEINRYRGERERTKNRVISAVLLLVGIILLFLMGYGQLYGWYGEDSTASIVTEVIDDAASVFIWEAITILFLEPSENFVSRFSYIRQIESIVFYHGERKTELYVLDMDKVFSHSFTSGTRLKRWVGNLFLIAGSVMIIVGVNGTIRLTTQLIQAEQITSATTRTSIISYILYAIEIFAGIAALETYSNRGRLRKLTGFFAISALVLAVMEIVSMSMGNIATQREWISSGFSCFICLVYFLGYLFYRREAHRR